MKAETRSEEFWTGNKLLDSLPKSDRARLASQMTLVEMPRGALAFEQNERIIDVHFPVRGVLSLVTRTQDGSTIEVSTLGNEGTTSVPIFLGAHSMINARCVSQVEGESLRMNSDAFHDEASKPGPLMKLMNSYTQALLTQVGQAVACSALHPTSRRCARWLLMTHDRARRDEFILTHEFLSYMLGVRRASVTDAVGPLRKAGIISYHRGHLRILDRPKLEAAACECYELMRSVFERVVGNPLPA